MTRSRTDVPEQTHEAMRAAALRPVDGPAATSVQAAGGGLELPGRRPLPAGEQPFVGINGPHPHEPIPGERDRTTLTAREPGAMGGAFNGQDAAGVIPDPSMSARTLRERAREGGGAEGEARLTKGA